MTRKERIRFLLEKDEREMQAIYDAVAAGVNPDTAAALIVGGQFRLCNHVKSVLKKHS